MTPWLKGALTGLLVGVVATVVVVLWAQRREKYVSDQFQAQIDSILRDRTQDSLRLAATQDTLRQAQASIEASAASAETHVHTAVTIATTNPVPKPDSTCPDSVRFWSDSASKAQRAFVELKLGADTALPALHRAVQALQSASRTVFELRADKSRLTVAVDSLNNALHRATRPISLFGGCKLACVGPFAGFGWSPDGKLRPVIGLGVSIKVPWGG